MVERVDFTSSALELIRGTFILLYLLCLEALAFKTFRPVCVSFIYSYAMSSFIYSSFIHAFSKCALCACGKAATGSQK